MTLGKKLLVNAPILAYPQSQSCYPFILETDASAKGLGAMLAQQQADGKVHPITFASRSLSVHEHHYGISELETWDLCGPQIFSELTFRGISVWFSLTTPLVLHF